MQKGLVLLMFCCIAITQLISSIFLHCTCILIYPICQSSSQSLKIKRKLQKNVWGNCWASWLICTAQWQLDYTALLKSSQMSKKLKQTIFLNMMTHRDDPGSGGWASHQVRYWESCLAIPVMFATEESVPKQRLAQFTASYGNLENRTERKQSVRLDPGEKITTCSHVLPVLPSCLSVWLLGYW